MRAPYSLSCLLLLSLGACFPASDRREPRDPGQGTQLEPSWRDAVAEDSGPGCRRAGPKRRGSEELSALLGIARQLRGGGAARAGSRLRFGRQEGSSFLPAGGEKRSGTLGDLAEELNSYNRRKGGFTFRFGR
ncbi:orexigenic neuropeptide QRFP [Struthio camelus]|uniref:orexigenic neuropeptide QRFP n=1 Tax=Struthio camelus TaxID=8801 RepID=UPI003603E444